MNHAIVIPAFTCLFFSSMPAFADLEWETQRINHTASITDDKTEVVFTFTNTGDKPVTIESVRTSCGCTTATLDKTTYAPEETGGVTAVFAFGDRTGTQHKRITVRTSTPPEGPPGRPAPGSTTSVSEPAASDEPVRPVVDDTALYLKVTIPEPVKVRPRMVYWKPGEATTPKTVQITINHDSPVTITQGDVEGDTVVTTLKTVEPGKRYELVLTPKMQNGEPQPVVGEDIAGDGADAANKADPQSTVVNILAAFDEDRSRTYSVLARVIRNESEAGEDPTDEPSQAQAAQDAGARRLPVMKAPVAASDQ